MVNRAIATAGLFFWTTQGCVSEPLSVHATNNAEVPVEKLFTHEGCTVFRFKDGGFHYYVRCEGNGTSAATLGGCGKGCEETVPTVENCPPPLGAQHP
jgi:hypothetical protein